MRETGSRGPVTVTARVTCPELGLDHVVEGRIDTGEEA